MSGFSRTVAITAVGLQLLKNLELLLRKRNLSCAAICLGEAIVGLCNARLERRCATSLLDRFGVSLVVPTEDAELQKTPCELWIERHGASQQCLDAPQIVRFRARPFSPPEAQRIIKMRHRILRVRLDETGKALRNLWRKLGAMP